MADQAQLGSMPSISLGGYIPAANRTPKLWESVLAQFVGNMAGQAGGALVDRVTAPDTTAEAARLGVADAGPHGLKRGMNMQEVGAASAAQQNKAGTEANIKEGARRGDLETSKLGLDIADSKDRASHMAEADRLAQEHLAFSKEQFAQAQNLAEKQFWADQINHIALQTGQERELNLKERMVPSEIEKNLGIASGAAAGVPVKDTTAELNAAKAAEQRRKTKSRQEYDQAPIPFK